MLRDKKMAEVFWLLAHGADVNAYNMRPKAPYTRDHRYGWTPLMLAAAWGNTAVVKKLLELKANINAQSNQEETSQYFFSKDDYKAYHLTALHIAVKHGRATTILALLKGGAKVTLNAKHPVFSSGEDFFALEISVPIK